MFKKGLVRTIKISISPVSKVTEYHQWMSRPLKQLSNGSRFIQVMSSR